MPTQWSFSGYTFPFEDSPDRGQAGTWRREEKRIEHDPLMANETILTSWGFKSQRRTITGSCGRTTMDTILQMWEDREVGQLVDSEAVSTTCRIIDAKFEAILPKVGTGTGRYRYTIEFMKRP